MQRLGDAQEEDIAVQILNDVLEQCKMRITKVEIKEKARYDRVSTF